MDAEAKEAFEELVEALGDRVEEVDLFPSATEAWDWHKTIMDAEMAANLEREWTQRARQAVAAAARADRARARGARGRLPAGAARHRAGYGEPGRAVYASATTPFSRRPSLGVAPKGLSATGDPALCTLWTLLGMPALSLPLMQGADGLPLGVQLVGRRNFDARLLRTARWLAGRLEAQG